MTTHYDLGTFLGKPVAIKVVQLDDTTRADFEKEVQIVVALHHPNIVECPGAAMKTKEGIMVLELLAVSLNDALYEDASKSNVCQHSFYSHAIPIARHHRVHALYPANE